MHHSFQSPAFLREQVESVASFYRDYAVDPAGGFFHSLTDDGSVYDAETRHLVSSARFVYLFATAADILGRDDFRDLARHGIAFLQEAHFQPDTETYAWYAPADPNEPVYAYGLAFVLLAGSVAMTAGITEGGLLIERAWEALERLFRHEEHGLYADQWHPTRGVDRYRGQNANMHACEACIAAYEATGQEHFLHRAFLLADRITRRLPRVCAGSTDSFLAAPVISREPVWEHYTERWQPDWDFNRDKPDDLFRPWGFQPGHHVEWAKLLLQLKSYRSEDWLLPRSRELFAIAVEYGWDQEHRGFFYGFAPDGTICAPDKYYWVQAEAIGAAALLHAATGDDEYARWYVQLWTYVHDHFIDHAHGAWYRILSRDNRRYDDRKSPPGKAGYHPVGACVTALSVYGS